MYLLLEGERVVAKERLDSVRQHIALEKQLYRVDKKRGGRQGPPRPQDEKRLFFRSLSRKLFCASGEEHRAALHPGVHRPAAFAGGRQGPVRVAYSGLFTVLSTVARQVPEVERTQVSLHTHVGEVRGKATMALATSKASGLPTLTCPCNTLAGQGDMTVLVALLGRGKHGCKGHPGSGIPPQIHIAIGKTIPTMHSSGQRVVVGFTCVLRVTLGNVPRGVCLHPHFPCKRTIPRFHVERPRDMLTPGSYVTRSSACTLRRSSFRRT
jgi:hypothetical protein